LAQFFIVVPTLAQALCLLRRGADVVAGGWC